MFDGAIVPVNPGGVAIAGWIIKDQLGNIIAHGAREVCRGDGATSNVAEWAAVVDGIKTFKAMNRNIQLEIRGDSKLVIDALGKKAKGAANLVPYKKEANKLLQGIQFTSQWVPREQNREADALCERYYKTIEPFDPRSLSADHWWNEPITEDQASFLRTKGVVDIPLTKGKASALISRLIKPKTKNS